MLLRQNLNVNIAKYKTYKGNLILYKNGLHIRCFGCNL